MSALGRKRTCAAHKLMSAWAKSGQSPAVVDVAWATDADINPIFSLVVGDDSTSS
jgi:hypothetical protein